MELRQLEYFVLLADELNFTRAAARGNVAQPALSRQIQKLEAELGVPLVDRTTRRVSLTSAGDELLGRARHILTEIDAATAIARESSALLRGRVQLGITQTPGSVNVPNLLAGFHEAHPQVELAVRESLSIDLVQRLRADEIDIAFVTAVVPMLRDQLTFTPVADEDLLLVVPQRHDLASAGSVGMEALRGEPFVAFPAGATIRATVDEVAAEAGFSPRILVELSETDRTLALVGAGLGVAVLPRSDAERGGHATTVVSFRDSRMRHEVFIASRSRRTLSPAAAELLKRVRQLSAAPSH